MNIKQVIKICKMLNSVFLLVMTLFLLSGCSVISWAQVVVSQKQERDILAATEGKKLYPAVRPPNRSGLSVGSVRFLEGSEVGSRGQISFEDEVLNVTIQNEYTAANGRFCKKALSVPTHDIPQQLLAFCKKPPDEPWRLTRSILSMVPGR